jgi:hypothetical protein
MTMNEHIQAPKKMSEWRGQYVVSREPIANSYVSFPAGTLFKITNEPSINKNLKSKPCKCCGVSGLITVQCSKADFLMDFIFVEPDERF